MTFKAEDVDNWLGDKNKVGPAGLVLFHNIAEHIANERDWDGAARLISKADDKVRRSFTAILRARFGSRLTMKRDVTHKSGIRFTMKWGPDMIPHEPQLWAVVKNAVANGAHYDDVKLHKSLRQTDDDEDKEYDVAAKAKRDAKLLIKEGINPLVYIAQLKMAVENENKGNASVIDTPKATPAQNVVNI